MISPPTNFAVLIVESLSNARELHDSFQSRKIDTIHGTKNIVGRLIQRHFCNGTKPEKGFFLQPEEMMNVLA